jgi:hypothetical protein
LIYLYPLKTHLFFLLIFALTAQISRGQLPQLDSITRHYDGLSNGRPTHLDSAGQRVNSRIDSAQLRLNSLLNPDVDALTQINFRKKRERRLEQDRHEREGLRLSLQTRIDSLQKLNLSTERYVHQLDSLEKIETEDDLAEARLELDSTSRNLRHQIDSLKALNLSTDRYTRKLDSLNAIDPAKYLESKGSQLQSKVNEPLDNVENKINEKLSLMSKEGGEAANIPGSADLPGANLSLNTDLKSSIDLPTTDLKLDNPLTEIDNPLKEEMGRLGELKGKLNDIKSTPQEQITRIKSIDEVKGVQDKLGQANELTDKAQAYGGEVKSIASGDLGEVKELPKALEEKVSNLDELKELEKQTGGLSEYKDMIGKGNDPEALKEMAKEQAVTLAKDHFAGRQEALQAAMSKMSKLKSKYDNVSNLKDLPKRRPNAMKGKPLIERIIPGMTFQIQKPNNLLVDVNPVISYRITGRVSAGAGWNERASFAKWNMTVPIERIYGPRGFASFSFKNGFALKAEGEKMNVFIPPYNITPDAGSRQWVWSVFVGLKKDYQFMKKVKGNAQFLYNLYDDHDQSPYVQRVNVRMGFEFPMKKKSRRS